MDLKEVESAIITAIKEATSEVFSTMLMLEVKSEESFCQAENQISTDVISSLHFFGERYMGKIALFASGKMACHLGGAMLGMEVEEMDTDVKDCMGEIANMVAGGAKTRLEDKMGVLHLLTPWVISGKYLKINTIAGDGEEEEAVGVGRSIESHAQFSWIMTKFITGDDYFFVGVQPNDVPQYKSDESALAKRVKELEEENDKLKKENEGLRA